MTSTHRRSPLFRALVAIGAWLALLCAGSPAADIVRPALAPTLTDGPAFESLLKQSRNIEANDTPRAVVLAREALTLATRLSDPSAELRARARLGDALRLASQYAEARAVVDAGLALPTSAAHRLEHAQLLLTSAQIHWNVGDFAQAEAAALATQHEAEILADQRLLIRVLSLRGILARRENQPRVAVEHLQAALALAQAVGELELLAQVRNNLANVHTDVGAIPEARTLLEENLRYRTEQGDRRGQANAILNLGSVEAKAGNHAAALDHYIRALAIRRDLGVPRHIASAQIAVATTLTRLGRTDEALAQLRAAAPVVAKVNSHDLSNLLFVQFAAAHAAREEFREALDFQRRAEAENTAVASAEAARTVAELRERFEAEKRSREIAELRGNQQRQAADLALKESELHLQRRNRTALVALLVLGGITVTAVIGHQRARARAERQVLEETRRARDAAQQANALKSHLLDLASHDLKAPLVGVMLSADSIAEEATEPAIVHRAQAVKQESQRMFDLVQNLLDTSAIESGERMLLKRPMDLAELVRDTAPALEDRLARKRQRLVLDTDSVCPMEGDALRLRQVLENLVDNASKFSPAATVVQVTVRGGATPRLEVCDQGPGLTEADRKNLFQRFCRLSARPTGGEPSTGLGLALVHDLVTQHGGRIWAEPAPGGGAAFIAEFPSAGSASP